eukprot:1154466-Pelagomonas_calceolata.AAC.5
MGRKRLRKLPADFNALNCFLLLNQGLLLLKLISSCFLIDVPAASSSGREFRHGHVCLQGQNLALVCSSERVGASYATDPVVVEQVLTGPRCQFRRTQETSVGAAAPTSLRGMPLARVSSCDIDGSHKSKHSCYTDAGLPRKYIVSGHCCTAASVCAKPSLLPP